MFDQLFERAASVRRRFFVRENSNTESVHDNHLHLCTIITFGADSERQPM
jgi:hypothetical protein